MTCQARELHEDCNCLRRKTIEHSQGKPQVRAYVYSVRLLAECRWAVVVFAEIVPIDSLHCIQLAEESRAEFIRAGSL
jgi:hypothetical protein